MLALGRVTPLQRPEAGIDVHLPLRVMQGSVLNARAHGGQWRTAKHAWRRMANAWRRRHKRLDCERVMPAHHALHLRQRFGSLVGKSAAKEPTSFPQALEAVPAGAASNEVACWAPRATSHCLQQVFCFWRHVGASLFFLGHSLSSCMLAPS